MQFFIQACLPILTKDATHVIHSDFFDILHTYYIILQEIVYKLYYIHDITILKEFFNANFMNKSLVSLSTLRHAHI